MPELQKKPNYFLIAFVLLWLSIVLFDRFNPDNSLKRFEFDTLIFLTAQVPQAKSPIVIVAIDEPSFAELKLQWPWPRSIYAHLIQQLQLAGTTVIAFDIGFYDRANSIQEDQVFKNAIEKSGIVVLSSYTDQIEQKWFSQTRTVKPLTTFTNAGAYTGNITVNLDTDGVLRKLPTQANAFWSIISNVYKQVSNSNKKEKNTNQFIHYSIPSQSFQKVSFYQALAPNDLLPKNFFKDTIVLVGFMNSVAPLLGSGFQDSIATPFSRFTGKAMFGTEIHAHLVYSALSSLTLFKANSILRFLMSMLTILMSWLIFKKWHPIVNALSAFGISALVYCFSIILFFHGIWLPITHLILAIWIVYLINGGLAYYNELSMRIYLRMAFSRYVSDNVINLIISNPEKLNLGGEREEVSFIFTDIADFIPLTENTPATILVDLINDYFEGMSHIVLSYNGTIERFVGDALVVFFNAPIKQTNHPSLAIKCALKMNDFGLKFSQMQQEKNIPFGITRIGVNTGTVSVGNFGGKRRFHYTAMGDAINVASRLENANKLFGTSICVLELTAKLCPDIIFRPISNLRLKGKNKPQLIMEPLDKNNFSTKYLQRYRYAYNLIEQDNETAQAIFEDLLKQNPNDQLLHFHLNQLKSSTNFD